MRSLRFVFSIGFLLSCQEALGWNAFLDERRQARRRSQTFKGKNDKSQEHKLPRKAQTTTGGGKGKTKVPTTAPSRSPTPAQQTPHHVYTWTPQASPPPNRLTPAPIFPTPAYTTISNPNDGSETTLCETQIPISASPIVESVLYFRYKLTLPDNSHETQLRALEPILNQHLSNLYLADCLFYDETTFSVLSLETAPRDVLIPNQTCGDYCRYVSAGITIQTFYILPNRKRFLVDDPVVAESFGMQIRWILTQISSEQVLWDLEFVALEPLGVNEAPTYEQPPDVAAAVSQSQERRAPVSWGAVVLGLAAMALVVVTMLSIRHRRKLAEQREDKAGLQQTYLADQERYTYDGGDGIQYLVNDELMLDANGGIEAVNGGWAPNHLNETPPPLYVQVQRSYETPDTLDL